MFEILLTVFVVVAALMALVVAAWTVGIVVIYVREWLSVRGRD